jgi:parvulin-like peptidyl-prolyl isomerase
MMYVVALWLCCMGSAFAQTADRVAAVVNDDVIALSEVYELGSEFIERRCPAVIADPVVCYAEAETEVLETLIKWSLVRQELSRLKMGITADEVESAIGTMVSENNFESRDALKQYIEEMGGGWDPYVDQLKDTLRMQRFKQAILAPRVTISEDELLDIYQRTARRDRREAVAIDAFGVVLPAAADGATHDAIRADTRKLWQELTSGAVAWDQAVMAYDAAGLHDVVSGRMYKVGELNEELDTAVFEAALGDILEPVEVGSVLFVVRLLDRKMVDGDLQPLEEIRGQLQDQLFQFKLEQVEEEWYGRAKRQAAVRVMLGQE